MVYRQYGHHQCGKDVCVSCVQKAVWGPLQIDRTDASSLTGLLNFSIRKSQDIFFVSLFYVFLAICVSNRRACTKAQPGNTVSRREVNNWYGKKGVEHFLSIPLPPFIQSRVQSGTLYVIAVEQTPLCVHEFELPLGVVRLAAGVYACSCGFSCVGVTCVGHCPRGTLLVCLQLFGAASNAKTNTAFPQQCILVFSVGPKLVALTRQDLSQAFFFVPCERRSCLYCTTKHLHARFAFTVGKVFASAGAV